MRDSVADLNADWILEKVDFDKVMLQPQDLDMRVNGSPGRPDSAVFDSGENKLEDLWDVNMPVDISLSESGPPAQTGNLSLDDKHRRHNLMN
mgnify:CR=1 FL=1